MYNIDEVIYGLEFTKAMITFNPSTGEDIEPENLNEDNKITYDACVGAITLLKEQEAKTIINKWHKNPLGDYSRLHCPWCNRELDMQSAKEYVACPYCGRKVKWDEQPRTFN